MLIVVIASSVLHVLSPIDKVKAEEQLWLEVNNGLYGGFIEEREVWVDDDWAGNTTGAEVAPGKFFGYNAFATIQKGINSVASGGTATLQVWVGDELQSTQPSLQYGYASTWQEKQRRFYQ